MYYQPMEGGHLRGAAVMQFWVAAAGRRTAARGFPSEDRYRVRSVCECPVGHDKHIARWFLLFIMCVFLMKEAEIFITFLFIFGYSSNTGLQYLSSTRI